MKNSQVKYHKDIILQLKKYFLKLTHTVTTYELTYGVDNSNRKGKYSIKFQKKFK